MKKQYVGISRDHSGSMSSLRRPAIKDYNDSIAAIKTAAKDNDIDTVASVTSCGIRGTVQDEVINSSVSRLQPIDSYIADGGTPLFDSVGRLIEVFKSVPDYSNPDVTFLVMAITDGEENASRSWKHTLGAEIKRLQATDRWTFVFRVPRGYSRNLENLGIPSGNIQEWDQTERGLRESSVQTVSAVSDYFSGVSRGIRSTKTFYANIGKFAVSNVYRPAKINYPGLTNGPVATLAPVAVLLTKSFSTPAKVNAQRALRACFATHLSELQDSGSRNWAEVQAGDVGTLNNYLELPTTTTTTRKK